MKLKAVTIEVAFIIGVFALMWIIEEYYLAKHTLDINLHDTYFVVDPIKIRLLLFLLVLMFMFLVREAFYSYKRRFHNLVLIVCNLLLIVILLPVLSAAAFFSTMLAASPVFSQHPNGWTIYPPLSALPKAQLLTLPSYPFVIQYFTQIASGSIILFVLILTVISIFTGKNWNAKRA